MAIVSLGLAGRPQEVHGVGSLPSSFARKNTARLAKAAGTHRERFTDHLLALPGLKNGF